MTRPWIIPGEVIIRETADSAYIYKASLKVMLEQDHLKNSALYNFSDPRLKELNEYSSKLIREKIIPQLTREVNSSANYASLRQVFYSLILARWFKGRFSGKAGLYSGLINSANLSGLTSKTAWSKTTYFKAYQKSFANGEYNIKEQVTTGFGPVIRAYFSGGVALGHELTIPTPAQPQSGASVSGTFVGSNTGVTAALKKNAVPLIGNPSSAAIVPELAHPKMWAEGFTSPAEAQRVHDEVLKGKIDRAFQEGRVRDLKGLRQEDQEFVLNALTDDHFIIELANRMLATVPTEKSRALHDVVKRLVVAYETAPWVGQGGSLGLEKKQALDKLKALLIDQTRFAFLDLGDNTVADSYLVSMGDITSPEHKAFVAHMGTFAYKGTEKVIGGPRTIYMTAGRIDAYRRLGNDGRIALQQLIGHEFRDLIAGRHVDESLPTLSAANEKIKQGHKGIAAAKRIRTEFTVPEGQPKDFFTHETHEYRIGELFAKPIEQIPDAVVEAVKNKLSQAMREKKILSADVRDFEAVEIDIHVTHRYGELNAAVQRVVLEAMREGCLKAQELGLFRKGINVKSMSLVDLSKALRIKYVPVSITERAAEPVMVAKLIGAGIGAANLKLYHEFFQPGSVPTQILGFTPEVGPKDKPVVRGYRAVVRKAEDVLKGNFDGDVWEFETASECMVKGRHYPSINQSLELKAKASQPNDYLITEVYISEGSILPSSEPLVRVNYQAVYGEEGKLRTVNPTFIYRSQNGATPVGAIGYIQYQPNFVPGGPNGERYVVTKPVTLEEARKAPPEGIAYAVLYGWMSEAGGVIPKETGEVIDHVAINPPSLETERKLADFLASVMTTHQHDQPYLAPFAAEAQAAPIREEQSRLFQRAPKEADIDSVMDGVEARVASGELLSVDDDKGDMGGLLGHNFTPQYMLAIDLATGMQAVENGELSDAGLIGFIGKERLKNGITYDIGDDSHILMLGDKSRNALQGHKASFLAFTRGYLASMVGNTTEFDPTKPLDLSKAKKPYARGQDYQGKEAKKAKANPYFYSQFNEHFFQILRQVMPVDYMPMVDNLEKGWRHWEISKEQTAKLFDPFSGNVSQQGIGTARYLVNTAIFLSMNCRSSIPI